MQSCLKRLNTFSLYLELYPCIRIKILSVLTTLMGVFFSLIYYISPSSHPHFICFQPYLRTGDINEVKTGVFRLKGYRSSSPLLSSCGIYSQLESIHSCSYWANNTTKALANCQQKNTELLPNVPLYNWLYLMGLSRLKCHPLPHPPFAQYPLFPC